MDPIKTTSPEPGKKQFPWLPVAGGCCALLAVGAIVFVVVASNLARKAIDQINKDPEMSAQVFFAALKADPSYAYTLTAAEFKASTTEEDLVNYVEETTILKDYTVLNFPQIAKENEELTILVGTIETDTEYTSLYVETTLEDDGKWRVNYFELGFEPSTEDATDTTDGTETIVDETLE